MTAPKKRKTTKKPGKKRKRQAARSRPKDAQTWLFDQGYSRVLFALVVLIVANHFAAQIAKHFFP
jgi:hypothetical protein